MKRAGPFSELIIILLAWVGMGIENRFLFRTGSQWTDSLESLAKFFNDSANGSLCREFVNSDCSKHVSFLNNLRLRWVRLVMK